jgi:hypothetical protein
MKMGTEWINSKQVRMKATACCNSGRKGNVRSSQIAAKQAFFMAATQVALELHWLLLHG